MEVTTGKIYKCDFCGKRQFRQCDMTMHERWCKENPKNNHKCFQFCRHLIKTSEEYDGENFVGHRTIFTCELTKQGMFSYIAERKRLPVINEKDSIRMPLECDKFEDEFTHVTKDIDINFEEWF